MQALFDQIYGGKKNVHFTIENFIELSKIKKSYANQLDKLAKKMTKLPFEGQNTSEILRENVIQESVIQRNQCSKLEQFAKLLEAQRRNLADSARSQAKLFTKIEKDIKSSNQKFTKTMSLDKTVQKNFDSQKKAEAQTQLATQKKENFVQLNFEPIHQYVNQMALLKNKMAEFSHLNYSEYSSDIYKQFFYDETKLKQLQVDLDENFRQTEDFILNQKSVALEGKQSVDEVLKETLVKANKSSQNVKNDKAAETKKQGEYLGESAPVLQEGLNPQLPSQVVEGAPQFQHQSQDVMQDCKFEQNDQQYQSEVVPQQSQPIDLYQQVDNQEQQPVKYDPSYQEYQQQSVQSIGIDQQLNDQEIHDYQGNLVNDELQENE